MAGRRSSLGRKQEEAIIALLTQRNIEEAAKSVGISGRTLLRWLQLEDFDKAYRKAKRDAYGQSIARLQQGSSAAATTLVKALIDPNCPWSVKVRAADIMFSHGSKAIEIEDIDARVEELERAASQSRSNGR